MSRVERLQARASAWIMRRPGRAWWVTLLGLFVITAAVPAGVIEQAAARGDQPEHLGDRRQHQLGLRQRG